jgi:hypothetical protein
MRTVGGPDSGRFVVEWNELVGSLGRFGLSEREARLYLACLRRGQATARELARDVRVERVVGYRILESMRARGLVEIATDRPRRFVPVDPRVLVERNLQDRRTALAEDERVAWALGEALVSSAGLERIGNSRDPSLSGGWRLDDAQSGARPPDGDPRSVAPAPGAAPELDPSDGRRARKSR